MVISMNFTTRVKRGAIRTKVLIENKLGNRQRLANSRILKVTKTARSMALTLLAVRTVMLPVPMAHATPAFMAPEDAEPPSTSTALPAVAQSVLFDLEKGSLTVMANEIAPVSVGKSNATEREEEEQRRLAALRLQQELENEKRRLELAKRRMQEEQRILAATSSTQGVTGEAQEKLRQLTMQIFGEKEWSAMYKIVQNESNFNPNAVNWRSGACGLFQALPCKKMGGMELDNQLKWGVSYIKERYGSPSRAWAFWQSHRWY